MGKISTYATDSNVTFADKLIGTDAENSDETKNFTVGSVLAMPLPNVQEFPNNAAAVAAGLPVGKVYRITGTDHAGIVW
jgi:hypothetical protein